MTRWKFFGLITLMIISLLGIIWVQLIWINNAIAVRNDLFNRSVYQSMQATAIRMESSRNIQFFERMMLSDSLFRDYQHGPARDPNDATGNGKKIFQAPGSSVGTSESFSIRITGSGDKILFSSDIQASVHSDTSFNIADPSMDEISGNSYTGRREQVIRDDQFQNWVRQKSTELSNMGDQMINELYNWEVHTATDRDLIFSTLRNELSNSGIYTPFEFAVIENEKVVDGLYSQFKESEFISSNYSVGLFPGRLIDNNARLALQFPERKNYILGSMSLILGASSVFSLIILLTFALSIYFIIRQKKISEMKSDFINNMTHEFKTPIATISLAADTISNPKIIGDQEKVKHFIGMIKKENIRMNKQVENILQISTLDKSEMEFTFEQVDLHSIIQHSIETVEIQVTGRGGNIFFYPEAENPVITGDGEHLTNLVHNLLDNANKYSPDIPEITVRTEKTDSGIKLTVEDKGMGMSKSVQARIFERFYRQEGGNVHNVKGFGLGLSYVKAIVEAHNGTIEVTSEPSKGTRFDVYLQQK